MPSFSLTDAGNPLFDLFHKVSQGDPGNSNPTQGVTAYKDIQNAKDASLSKNADPFSSKSNTIPSLPGYAPQDVLGHRESPSTLGYPATPPVDAIASPDIVVSSNSSTPALTSSSPSQGTAELPTKISPKTITPVTQEVQPTVPQQIPSLPVGGVTPLGVTGAIPQMPNDPLDKSKKEFLESVKNWTPIGTQSAAEQPNYIDQMAKQQGRSPLQLLANIGDVVGTGLRAYRDPTAQTRLQKAYETALSSQQEANKQFSQNASANSQTSANANANLGVTQRVAPTNVLGQIAAGLAPIVPTANAAVGQNANTVGYDAARATNVANAQANAKVFENFATQDPDIRRLTSAIGPQDTANVQEFLGKLPGNLTLEKYKTYLGLVSEPGMLQTLSNPSMAGVVNTANPTR